MKKWNITALLLCLSCVISMLAGCGSTQSSSLASTTTSEATEEVTISEEMVEETSVVSSDSLFVDVTLPLCEETTVLTMWWGGFDGGNFGNDHPGVTLISQAAQEATNVEISYSFCSGMEFEEQTALMFATGDYADMIKGPSMYSGGLSAGVEDDVFLDLTDYMQKYSPNYYARITSDEDLYKQVVTDEGYMVKYYTIYDQPTRQENGLLVRSDYLETVGLDAPETYEDWYTMLAAFQTELGLTAAYNLDTDGLVEMLMAGYGVSSDWMQIDGTVVYSPATEGYKEYLTMIHEWYEAGYVSDNFMNENVSDDRLNNIYDGNFAAYVDDYGSITSFKTLSDDENFATQAVQTPTKTAGETTHFYSGGDMVSVAENGGIAISTNCSDVELCMQWMDFFYSLEGSLIYSYGVLDETYTDNGDGTYSFTEFITNNPDGWGITFARLIYLDGCAGTGLYWTDADIIDLDQGSLDADEVWHTNCDDAYVIPDFDLNSDEASTFSSLMADIDTYVEEMTLKFITGAESMDNYDSYLESLNSMQLEKAIALYQDGLDRYNAR